MLTAPFLGFRKSDPIVKKVIAALNVTTFGGLLFNHLKIKDFLRVYYFSLRTGGKCLNGKWLVMCTNWSVVVFVPNAVASFSMMEAVPSWNALCVSINFAGAVKMSSTRSTILVIKNKQIVHFG